MKWERESESVLCDDAGIKHLNHFASPLSYDTSTWVLQHYSSSVSELSKMKYGRSE